MITIEGKEVKTGDEVWVRGEVRILFGDQPFEVAIKNQSGLETRVQPGHQDVRR